MDALTAPSQPLALCPARPWTATVVLGIAASCVAACTGPREAGPHEDEFGKVMFWEVESQGLVSEGCTDAPAFQDALTLPPLEEGTFFIYELAKDGQTAVGMDCTGLDADACQAVDDIVFEVKDSEMVFEAERQEIDRVGACTVSLQETWRFVDRGEDGTMELSLAFPFGGPDVDCDTLDAEIASEGDNGLGLGSWEVVWSAEVRFAVAD